MSTDELAKFLRDNIEHIISLWIIRIKQEVIAARTEDRVVLKDEIPTFLACLADSLSNAASENLTQEIKERILKSRVAREHGVQRAASGSYSLGEAIFEYHILRLVLFSVLEEGCRPLEAVEREIIVSSIEMAVQEMASEFAKSQLESHDLFVLTLVHDLRGPLNNASMATQLLSRSPSPDVGNRTLEKLKQNLSRLDKMITSLLDLRKIFSGEAPALKFEEINIVVTMLGIIEELNLDQRIKLESPHSVTGRWSQEGMRRVIENLISNALKYGTPDSPISITIEDTSKEAVLSFHNTGPSIPESQQSRIFRPFFQSESKTASGWGIGLALVKAIIDLHHGSISVNSTDSTGTEFVIKLPKEMISPAKPKNQN
jgi:signal transduction histidine kinase